MNLKTPILQGFYRGWRMQFQYSPSVLLLLSAWCFMSCLGSSNLTSLRPGSVKIGALLAFNTTIGKLAQQAIQLAVQDVNNALNLLNGTKLELEMFDSGCSPVQGAASAVELLKRGVVAVVGPQSSAVAQFAAHIGNETKVPFVSFGATDPNLSETQYPYFMRVVPSDRLQMEAVAVFIANFGWREVVVFHMDDDYGTNGASKLSDSLQERGSKVVEKVALVPWIDKAGIDTELTRLAGRQTRVFVLHTQQNVGYLILQEAYFQNMLEAGYVWIVTDLIANNLVDLQAETVKYMQGVIGIRRYVPQSSQMKNFLVEWGKISPTYSHNLEPSEINAYTFYAYDAVWTVARALAAYLNDKQGDVFQEPTSLPVQSGGESELAQMKIFEGGVKLRELILRTEFMGISGNIKFDNTGDLAGAAFEYINMAGRSPYVVGYWQANDPGASLKPPLDNEELSNMSVASNDVAFLGSMLANSIKMPIIWPGKVTDAPRGWVLPKNGQPLKIGVPRKAGYTQLVRASNGTTNNTKLDGFCIEVFEAALKYLPYAVPHDYELIGDGVTTPTYNDLVRKLANQVRIHPACYDALVHTKLRN